MYYLVIIEDIITDANPDITQVWHITYFIHTYLTILIGSRLTTFSILSQYN